MTKVTLLQSLISKEKAENLSNFSTQIETADFSQVNFKNPKVALFLSIFLGFLGIDRLYQGGISMFLYKLAIILLTFGTWYIADIYFCRHMVEEENYIKLTLALGVTA